MEISTKALATIVVGAAILGGFAERAVTNRETAKQSSKETESTDNNITTIIKEHDNVDGSKDKSTTIVDKSKSKEQKQTESLVTTVVASNNWMLWGGVNVQQTYYAGLNRRILGPVYLGVWGSTAKDVGLSIAVQF